MHTLLLPSPALLGPAAKGLELPRGPLVPILGTSVSMLMLQYLQ